MAKRSKPVLKEKDGDIYLDTGIFERVVHWRPRSPADAYKLMWLEAAWMDQSIDTTLGALRQMFRPLIEPYLERIDDLEAEIQKTIPGAKVKMPSETGGIPVIDLPVAAPLPFKFRILNLGDGYFPYRVNLDQDARTLEVEKAGDALSALYEIRDIERANALKDFHALFVATLELGRLLEKVRVRKFEPLVLGKKAQQQALAKYNSDRPSSEALRRQAMEAMEQAEIDHPERKSDRNFIKEKAAKKLGISKRALNTRLSKGLAS